MPGAGKSRAPQDVFVGDLLREIGLASAGAVGPAKARPLLRAGAQCENEKGESSEGETHKATTQPQVCDGEKEKLAAIATE